MHVFWFPNRALRTQQPTLIYAVDYEIMLAEPWPIPITMIKRNQALTPMTKLHCA